MKDTTELGQTFSEVKDAIPVPNSYLQYLGIYGFLVPLTWNAPFYKLAQLPASMFINPAMQYFAYNKIVDGGRTYYNKDTSVVTKLSTPETVPKDLISPTVASFLVATAFSTGAKSFLGMFRNSSLFTLSMLGYFTVIDKLGLDF